MFTAVSRHLQRRAGPRLCSWGKVVFLSQGIHPQTCQECSLWEAWLVPLTFQLLREQEVIPRAKHPQIKGTVQSWLWTEEWGILKFGLINSTTLWESSMVYQKIHYENHGWFSLGRQNHLTQYSSGPRFWTATPNKFANFLRAQSPIFDSGLSEVDPEIFNEASWCTGKIGDTGQAPMNTDSVFVILLNQRDYICLTRTKTATEKCLLTLP